MCDCWDNRPEFFDARDVVARKDHECCECRGVIKKGETYEYVSGKWEGGLDTFKTCLTCAAERAELTKSDPDGCGPCFGELRQYKRELVEAEEWRRNPDGAGLCGFLTGLPVPDRS